MFRMRLKAWIVTWYAHCVGGRAVWVRDDQTGRIYLKVARPRFDPFDVDGNPLLTVNLGTPLGTRTLDMKTNRVMLSSHLRWRYVDYHLHIEMMLRK